MYHYGVRRTSLRKTLINWSQRWTFQSVSRVG